MKNKTVIFCVLIAAFGISPLISGCSTTIGPVAKQQAGLPRENVDAHALFAENCARCHGNNGRAHTFHGWVLGAQNFTDPVWQQTISDEEIVRAIETGPGPMPAFQDKLSEAEIEALAAYVQTFKPAQ